MSQLQETPERPSPRYIWFLALVTVLAYIQVITFPFLLLDDTPYILQNPGAQHWSEIPGYFVGHARLAADDNAIELPYYRPIPSVWVVLNYQLFGPRPVFWHLSGLALYLAGVLLFHRLAWKLTKSDFVALAAALLYALHPVHVEGVAWISGSTVETVVSVFFFGSFLAYLKWRENRQTVWLAFCGALTLVSLLSKETAAALPVLILAHLVIFRPSGEKRAELWRRSAPAAFTMIIVIGLYAALRIIGLHALVVLQPEHSWAEVLRTAPWLFVTYLRHAFWPVHLATWYDATVLGSVLDPRFYWPLAAVVAYVVVMIWALVRRPLMGFLMLWWAVLLGVPLLGVRAFRDFEIIRDRFCFIALAGLCLLVALALDRFPVKEAVLFDFKATSAGGLAVLAMVLGALTAFQVKYWSDDVSVYKHSIEVSPTSTTPRVLLANMALKRGDIVTALAMDRETMNICPDRWPAIFAYGITLEAAGERLDAIRVLTHGIQVAPRQAVLYHALARILTEEHDFQGAISVLRQGIALADRTEGLQKHLTNLQAALQQQLARKPDTGTGVRQ